MRLQFGLGGLKFVVVLALLIGFTGGRAWAQGASGGMIGTVSDTGAAVLSGATVTATNLNTGVQRETKSGADGVFRFTFLDPGQYRVEIIENGFKALTREPITVNVTETTDLQRLVLAVGETKQTVTVRGAATLLNTETATLGNVFDSKMIAGLPLATRNFTQLLSLQPGVVSDIPNPSTFGNGSAGFSVAGSREYDNEVLINGVNAVGSTVEAGDLGGSAVPAPDSIAEFKVQTELYSAEYGRAGGAAVNLITKSGTNAFHGNLYEFFRNEDLNANEYFYKRSQIQNGQPNHRPLLRQNQYGGTVGGPIQKDKTFFFTSYQATRQINGAAPGLVFTNSTYPYLPAGDRSNTAAFEAALGAIYGGRAGLFGGTAVAADGSNINPVTLKILQAKLPDGSYLLPSFPQSSLNDGGGGIGGGQVYSNGSFSYPSPFNEDQYNIDIDHSFSNRHTLSGKFFSAGQFTTTPAGTLPDFTFTTTQHNKNVAIADTYTFSPTLVNEALAGYTRVTVPLNRHDPITATDVGMIPAPNSDGKFPRIIIPSDGLDFGAAYDSNVSYENQFTYSDTVSKVIGSHSLRFGGLFLRHQVNTDQDITKTGQIFNYGFNDFLIGQTGAQNGSGYSNLLASFASSGSFAKDLRFTDIGVFIQDDWKVTSKLTLNLGFRWDLFTWPTETRGRLANFDIRKIGEGPFGIPSAAQEYTGYTIAKDFLKYNPGHVIPAGVAVVSNSGMDGNDFTNFAPRLGFAYQPRSDVTVHGGYGLFYPRLSTVMALNNVTGPPFNRSALAAFDPYGSMQDPFTFLDLPPNSAFPLWTPRVYVPGVAPTLDLLPVDPTARNPVVQQWNLSVQRQFGQNFVLEVAYLGSRGLRLLSIESGNQPAIASPSHPIRGVTTNTADAGNLQARSPVAGVLTDEGLAVSLTNGSSKYNAFTVSVNKRYSSGLQFLSAFTYGKSMDDNSLQNNGDIGNEQPPGNTLIPNWGLSSFDRKFRSTTSFVYDLPNRWARTRSLPAIIFGGWQTSGIFTIQSGNPITLVTTATGSAVRSQGNITPDLAPGKTLADVQGHGSVEKRLNNYFGSPGLGQPGSAFVTPGPTDYGQLSRGLPIRSPGEKSLDLALSKNFPIHDAIGLVFRAEAFNTFNWANFGGPDNTVSDPGFGIISSTTTGARVMQFALKLNF